MSAPATPMKATSGTSPRGVVESGLLRTNFSETVKEASDLAAQGLPMCEIAHLYAQAGISVFPADQKKKHPLVRGGFKARSKDVARVTAWWKQWPEALVGIVPGDLGLVALDADSTEAMSECIGTGLISSTDVQAIAVGEGGNDPSRGLVIATGGTSQPFCWGSFTLPPMHIYLSYNHADEPPALRSVVQRYKRGYVIAPGSWRVAEDSTRRTYRVLSCATPHAYSRTASIVSESAASGGEASSTADHGAPHSNREPSTIEAQTGQQVLEGAIIPHGQRHNLLRAASVLLAKRAASELEVLHALRLVDLQQCEPPMQAEPEGHVDLRNLSTSAWKSWGRDGLSTNGKDDTPLGQLLATLGPETWDRANPNVWQHSIRRFAASLASLSDPVEHAIAFQKGKAGIVGALNISPRDAELILQQALAHPIGQEAEATFGRSYTLRDLDDHPEWLELPEPAIPYLAWPSLKTLFSAREKAGKSTLAMAGAAAASSGRAFLNVEAPQRKVLWVSEEPIGVLMRRAKEMGADPEHFIMLPMGQRPLDQLVHHVAQSKAEIIVIDTLYRLGLSSVADENDSVQWGPVFDQLDRPTRDGKAMLLLAHATKKSKQGEYRGSTAIGGFVDVIINMKTPKRDDVSRTLDAVGRIPTQTVTVKLTESGFEALGGDKDHLSRSLHDHVVQYVSQHPSCTKTAIRQALPFRNADVDAAISKLVLEKRLDHRVTGNKNCYSVRPEFDVPEQGTLPGEAPRGA